MKIPFAKMSGTGNDFVVIDNRKGLVPDERKLGFVKRVCAPKKSIGADGVIFVEDSELEDFKWDFYNADGSSAEMCGNGGRCVARFAFDHKIAQGQLTFETIAGTIAAEVNGENVKVKLTPPKDFGQDIKVSSEGETCMVDFLNTGVPHAIVYFKDVDHGDIQGIGRSIRFHDIFAPAGTNVDLVQVLDRNTLKIRTYERGIEDETLACGTGAVASAILACRKGLVDPPVQVHIRSGDTLKIFFEAHPANGSFGDVFLEGPAVTTFEGTVNDS